MKTLNEAKAGRYYHVTWMISQLAKEIGNFMHLQENDVIYLDQNYGKGGVVVWCHGRRICMDQGSAKTLHVVPALAWKVA